MSVSVIKYFLALAILVSFSFNSAETNSQKENTHKESDTNKPNIIVLLCDDLGYGDLSSFGHPFIETPNLDKLGATGIKLTNFYSAAPVCSPSRVGLLTGRSPNRAGVYDFIPGPKKSEDIRDLVHLQAHEQTIPALLKTVGYSTCLVGKWHGSSKFNSDEQPKPDHFGFDHWMATHNNAGPSHQNPKNFVRNGEKVGEIIGFSSQIIVSEAIDWLEKKENNNPFFLEVAFHEPHEPIMSPENLVQKYLQYTDIREEAEYFANVENVDIAVGRLLAYLEENNIDNTLIVFSSDNGPETLHRYPGAKKNYGITAGLKGRKLWTNEAGIRVPAVMKWIGKETYTGTSDAVVSSLDFLPTFCELAGAKLPKNKLDGESFKSLLDKGNFKRSSPLIWAFYDAVNNHRVAMRSGNYKIMARLVAENKELPHIHNLYDGNIDFVKGAELTDFVLFDLTKDFAESEDISGKEPKVFKKIKKEFEAEYKDLLAGSHVWVRDEE